MHVFVSAYTFLVTIPPSASLGTFPPGPPVTVVASPLRSLKSVAMHIHAELYERLKCLGEKNWKKICRDLLGVDLIDEVTVHEGEKIAGYHCQLLVAIIGE